MTLGFTGVPVHEALTRLEETGARRLRVVVMVNRKNQQNIALHVVRYQEKHNLLEVCPFSNIGDEQVDNP